MNLSITKTQAELESLPRSDKAVVFVPTMGALHAGHISLVEQAQQVENAYVVVSIFVNPTQFGEGEDFDTYPRMMEADCAKLDAAGVDAVFLPEVETMYPNGAKSTLSAGALGACWDGKHRPGHFDGVVTVVARLFDLVKPHVAIFGQKDYQQLAVIKHMVREQGYAIEIFGAPIMREADGLAMSSRNAYLNDAQRIIAPMLHEMIVLVKSGLLTPDMARQKLLDVGFDKVDYLAIVDGQTLEPIEHPISGARILVAAWLGKTRLIDNVEAA